MIDLNNNADEESTKLIPNPQGRNPSKSSNKENFTEFEFNQSPTSLDHDLISGLNPLIASANSILTMIPRIRSLVSHPNPKQLRELLAEKIIKFEDVAKKRSATDDDIFIARYALCTFLDETLSSTPWGASSDFVNKSLLVSFHKDAWGGEKFFQILNKLAEDPVSKIDLIEFFYVCLCLGFEGRFRVINNGNVELDSLRVKVAKIILNVRGQHEGDLSSHWRGENTLSIKTKNYFYIWLLSAASAMLLLTLYMFLSFYLSKNADGLLFQKLDIGNQIIKVQPSTQKRVVPQISEFLKPEIDQNLVAVVDKENTSKISILVDDLFSSGNATLNPDYLPLLKNISNALNSVSGRIVILGHTDNQPSRSIRFPSNWHLSKSRAENFGEYIKSFLHEQSRLTSEGMGESMPITPNDSEKNRSKNRRVEILLQITE